MRWLVFAAVAAFCSSGVMNSPPAIAEGQATDVATSIVVADPAVTITPIPTPAPVVELLGNLNSSREIRQTKKLKTAKASSPVQSMLSRTERHQVALLTSSPAARGLPVLVDFSDDEDVAPGPDDLDLHRSFSRPKVAGVSDQDDEDANQGLSDTVKLRLAVARMKAVETHAAIWGADQAHDDEALSDTVTHRLSMARMKALEVHAATWGGDQSHDDAGLSDTVKLRLYMARMKAIQAHEKKFS